MLLWRRLRLWLLLSLRLWMIVMMSSMVLQSTLVLSLALGLSHVNRCLFADAKMRALRDNWPLWLGWQVLLVLLSIRMARTLGLLA